jgi:PIN domain nuclease of toxin-antitoxin system
LPKVRLGKLSADPERLLATFEASGSIELPVFSLHAAKVATLPLHHGDPFDRMLVAQAMSEQMQLLTTDPKLPQYSNLVIHV